MKFAKYTTFPLLLIGCVITLNAQSDSRLLAQQAKVKKWKENIEQLKSIAFGDTKTLPLGEQALYLSLQAKILWKTDTDDARSLLKRAGEKMVSSLELTDKREFNEQLRYFPATFEVLSELDPVFAKITLNKIDESFIDSTSGQIKRDQNMSDLYLEVALQTVKINPEFAASLGKRALEYGFPLSFPDLIAELYSRDALLAEKLFLSAVSIARSSPIPASDTLLYNLCRISAFREKKEFPAAVVKVATKAFIDKLDDAARDSGQNHLPCGIVYFAPKLVARVDKYYPELSARFLQNIQTCTPLISTKLQAHAKLSLDYGTLSVDKLLDAARDANEEELKRILYREAFYKLTKSNDFERLLSLLDGLDGDDYKALAPISWDSWRTSTAAAYALKTFEEGDLHLTYRTIDKTPTRLRPSVRMELASNSSVAARPEFFLDNLNQMAKELQHPDVAVETVPLMYLFLARSYAKFLPNESTAMFHQAVKSINKADKANPDNNSDKDWAPMRRYVKIDPSILEIDEWSVFSSLNELDSKRSRIRIVLGLLESSLPKYVETKRILEQMKKSLRSQTKKI